MEELKPQIEAAFNYRGHVTLSLKDGEKIEGFLFNRVYENLRLEEDNFVELYPKNSDAKRRIKIAEIDSIALTGKNHAESYADGLKRTGTDKPGS